jgi:hypothetical protein
MSSPKILDCYIIKLIEGLVGGTLYKVDDVLEGSTN